MRRSIHSHDAYYNFAVAILTRAIDDCRIKRKLIAGGKPWIKLLQNDPEYYLFESNETGFPSFIGVCHLIQCNPDILRDRIKHYLMIDKAPFTGSSIKMLRRKIKEEREIMRSDLLRWVSKKLYVDRLGLDKLLYILTEEKVVMEEARWKEGAHKAGRFYCWIGE